MADICVIIVNYNGGRWLGPCLEAVKRQTFRDFDVVLVDNGSTDGSMSCAQNFPENWKIILAGENLGFAVANNLAARQTETPWLAMLNPDTVADENWLSEFVAARDRYPDVAMFGSSLINLDDSTRMDGMGDCYHISGLAWRGGHGSVRPENLPEGEVFAPCAAAAFYRRDVFEAAGGFDEDFFCYMEDVDLAFRLRLAGHRCIQLASSIVAHAGSAISGRRSAFAIYHGYRNLIWTFARNMPLGLMIVALPFHLILVLALLAKSLAAGGLGDAVRGFAAGYGGLGRALAKRDKTPGKIGMLVLAKSLVWSPLAAARRAIVVDESRIVPK